MHHSNWIIVIFFLAQLAVAQDDGNLIEYSYGGFSDGDIPLLGPMLFPPIVKIYMDGRIVFIDERDVWEGIIDSRNLASLKARLAKNSLLRETALIPAKKGAIPGLHGGMAYIRYQCGESEVILGTLLIPSSGPWDRLIKEIRSYIPKNYHSFTPPELEFTVYKGASWQEPVLWPFADRIHLNDHVGSFNVKITDLNVARFILKHGFGGFSWLQTNVTEDSDNYSLHLKAVAGWYEPQRIEEELGILAYEDEMKQKK